MTSWPIGNPRGGFVWVFFPPIIYRIWLRMRDVYYDEMRMQGGISRYKRMR